MLFKVLDEVCQHESHGLFHAQQAFVTGLDIIRNTTMLCRNFWAAHEEAVQGDDPCLLLALDCSKGYNRMDHSWLQRCLRAASTPPEILALVECLLVNMPVLILDGVDFAPLHLASGLEELPDSRERTGAPVLWLSCEGQNGCLGNVFRQFPFLSAILDRQGLHQTSEQRRLKVFRHS